jgi:hypothetical protein
MTAFAAAASIAGLCPVPGDATQPAAAQEKPEPGKPDAGKPDAPKPEMKPGADAQKDATRQDRAKKLVVDLELALVAARGAAAPDAALIKVLESSLQTARKLAEPITLKELTDEEKRSIGEELRKQFEGDKRDGPPGAGGPADWQKQALSRAFEGAELGEEDEIKATEIISDWFTKSQAARIGGDSKKSSDLKRDRDAALEKLLGKKKSQKVINNLNGMSNWGGRGK